MAFQGIHRGMVDVRHSKVDVWGAEAHAAACARYVQRQDAVPYE